MAENRKAISFLKPEGMRMTTVVLLCLVVAVASCLTQLIPQQLRKRRRQQLQERMETACRELRDEASPFIDSSKQEYLHVNDGLGYISGMAIVSPEDKEPLARIVESCRRAYPEFQFSLAIHTLPPLAEAMTEETGLSVDRPASGATEKGQD